jgi:hypothetical protein
MTRARRTATASLAAALAVLAAREPARAAPAVPARTTGFAFNKQGQLVASVGMQDLFSPADRQRLTSGFATRVLIRVALKEEGSDEPIAVAFQRSEIVYDLWDEKFRLRVTRGKGPEVHVEVRTPDEAIARAAVLSQFAVIEAARLRPGATYVLACRADLNPISEELMADVRRWLVLPARGQRQVSAGDSFFGSFVSIFVNPRIEDSAGQVRFFSQPFTLDAHRALAGEARH